MRAAWLLAAICSASLAAALCAAAAVQAGTTRPATRTLALDNIARHVLLPSYVDLVSRSTELSTAIDALVTAPGATALVRAREAWIATLLTWRRMQAYAHGPVMDLDLSSRIQFWPVRKTSVDRVLHSERPLDDRFMSELGANAVGLSALEVMLFEERQPDAPLLTRLTTPSGMRERRYLQLLAHDLVRDTHRIAAGWQGPTGYAARFAAGGQASLNLLVNDLLNAVEAGAQTRLRIVVDQQRAGALRPDLIEGSLSGTSHRGVLALLAGSRAALSGGEGIGLDDYLATVNPAASRRLADQFQRAIAAAQAIDSPLESAILRQRLVVERAQDESRTLEILLKTEVASALGVTLTFRATDGD